MKLIFSLFKKRDKILRRYIDDMRGINPVVGGELKRSSLK